MLDHYDVKADGVTGRTTTLTVAAPDAANPDAHIATATFTNQEKALGKLTIEKQLKDSAGNLLPADASRTFSVKVAGPSYPQGKIITISNAQATTLPDAQDIDAGIEGLVYGDYSILEVDAHGDAFTEETYRYDWLASIRGTAADAPITLSIDQQ